jgi:hypothetical protein
MPHVVESWVKMTKEPEKAVEPVKPKFDRKAYMREYMRKRRGK